MLFTVRKLVGQSFQFGPEGQQLAVFPAQVLLRLFDLNVTHTRPQKKLIGQDVAKVWYMLGQNTVCCMLF